MTTLSDRDLVWMMRSREIVVEPLTGPIQPASIDLHLGPELRVLCGNYDSGTTIDPMYHREPETLLVPFEQYVLEPDDFVQAVTLERIEITAGIEGVVTGKSSLARIGLQIESAGYVDPGWRGQLTLEIKNLGPRSILLRPGMKICQIRFAFLTCKAGRAYGHPELDSHYQNSVGPVSGRFSVRAPSDVPVVGDDVVLPKTSPA